MSETRAAALASLLVADDLRIDVEGVPACDGLGFRTTGSRVLVLGAPRALFEAVTGLRPVLRGSLTVRGRPAHEAAADSLIAGSAMAPPVPPRWSVREYVEWSARLSGVPGREAAALASAALDRLELGPLARTELARLVPHAMRATIVAAALATAAEIVALEDPLGGLADEVVDGFARILAAAIADRAWIVFAPRVPLTSALAIAADEAVVVGVGRIVAQGTPAEVARQDRRFVGRLHGEPAAIAPMLAARGARIEEHGTHLVFDLGDALTTSELFGICAASGVVLLELLPVARALA